MVSQINGYEGDIIHILFQSIHKFIVQKDGWDVDKVPNEFLQFQFTK